ncbi:hypothetical protein FZI85_12045 [Mycobacterium sp. CBMA293]|uniref:hypothetical protein n=1 Tax=unclassified Mycolicibacterium TaxID=2636767 RepID=UPI0012DEE516|nr:MULTISPECIES: hypothetical protein [unclassified Mycolicibacterium]MUL47886.1 hypothetical protein [Mycolicibacterium sp. CBMA 360]MUL59266.1 hypothetical protein [Mycolicibacterium sp. CBMA 335]MUL70991.1 hypothetical protein [Mycolicibacterium sp. CBMA 311]MUL94634.1 hypothetical protein [Mycolicibacterium sp. CBMA 230]MUM11754.1 hypothetical protein [Mycolicibacterium sp. CBMA 293]
MVVEPVVEDVPEVDDPVVDDPVDVLPPVDVEVSPPVVPVVEPVPVVLLVPELEPLPPSEDGRANATAASGPNANKPAVRRLEAASSRAWGITRRSPPLF